MQKGSAEGAYLIFQLVGIPTFREGFTFSIPGITIEVAEECSGIRSSLALLILSVLFGYLFLHSAWKKAFLPLFIVPIVIVKNSLRIVTISSLAAYVHPSFLTGSLHRYGGIPFFFLGFAVLALVVWFLQESESESGAFGTLSRIEKPRGGHD